jgi:hypothetical protein
VTIYRIALDLGPKDERDPDRETRHLTLDATTRTWASSDSRVFPRELKLMTEIYEAVRRYEGESKYEAVRRYEGESK